MHSIGPAIQSLLDNGVQMVSWGKNDAATFSRADYDFSPYGLSPLLLRRRILKKW